MRAIVFDPHTGTFCEQVRPLPQPAEGEVLLEVEACGMCRTDVHIVDGDLPLTEPRVLGHQIVGRVIESRSDITVGARVGVPWLGGVCGTCRFCRTGRENLCDHAVFTGYTRDGGCATHAVADARFCFELPEDQDPVRLAPLLCAGLIGHRAWRLAGQARTLGIYGFGAAGHILCQVATQQGQRVFAFTRPGDRDGQAFARELGAFWAAGSDEPPPEPLDAAILFAPVGALVPRALEAVDKGGIVVCGGIHMSDIPSFPYRLLWEERQIRSVANLTREDGRSLFALIRHTPVDVHVETWPLRDAPAAIDAIRSGRVAGAAVVIPEK
ncbi:MAG: zinc-binding alcohol dehydrogenase family protein [Candidatus Dadabacteria bacterium]|nr:MAG: zinc-binding alcohol dehydrogenase family protein [Candidatus Dadabacteria bacterium]